MQNIKLVPSSHGKSMILVDKFLFIKWTRRDNGSVYWKCIHQYKYKCKASLTTSSLNTDVISRNSIHTEHPEFNSLDVRLYECLDTVNKRVRDEYGSMSSIYRDELNKILAEHYDVDELAAKMPKFENKREKNFLSFIFSKNYKIEKSRYAHVAKKLS
ncbi:unnamed protein product [Brachionus calyciflorus]|uniref:FLYWCH-type domain-containing protein n=1 Tax=Brachionus calyciflorus TaxID=104777 RepID=A0A814LU77_9BILA|nr:unnamed protein product [Brachionus calyciflorus]